jgi:hypothetical protein
LLDGISTTWTGTAEALAAEVARLATLLELDVPEPSVRTIRLWRAKKLLGRDPGGRFGYRQLLEALAVAVLLIRGWTSTAIADLFAGGDNADLNRASDMPLLQIGGNPGETAPNRLKRSHVITRL